MDEKVEWLEAPESKTCHCRKGIAEWFVVCCR